MNFDDKIVIYQYYNYVSYKYRFLSDKEFTIIPRAACFSKLTYNDSYDPKVGVEVLIDAFTVPNMNGYCALTEEELLAWLAEIKQWIDYEYTLIKESDQFVIQLTTHVPTGALKILLTLIRFAFEAPFSLALKEAFTVAKKDYFPNTLILHRYQTIQNSIDYPTNTNHCFCTYQQIPLLTIDKLKEKVKNYTGYVNTFFGGKGNYNGTFVDEQMNLFIRQKLVNVQSELSMKDEDIANRVNNLYIPNFKVTYGQTD